MARKDVNKYTLVDSQSLAADFTTSPTVIDYTDNISYQINCFTTDSIGTFSLEISNDYQVYGPSKQVVNPGTWNPLVLGGGTPFVNAADAVISISLNQVPFSAIRLSYTSTTPGTGTCTVTYLSKQLGG